VYNTVKNTKNLVATALKIANFIILCTDILISAISSAALLVRQSQDRFPVVSLDFSMTYSFRPYHGPGVDSAPSENE